MGPNTAGSTSAKVVVPPSVCTVLCYMQVLYKVYPGPPESSVTLGSMPGKKIVGSDLIRGQQHGLQRNHIAARFHHRN